MTAASAVRTPSVRVDGGHRLPLLSMAVLLATLSVSVAALLRPALMALLVRDLPALRGGQWWRAVTPVFVQSSGWGQLLFNLVELGVVGVAFERCVSRWMWVLVFGLGGVGSVAVLSALRPADTGGGTSDAVAALIGALAALRVLSGRAPGWTVPAQVGSVFFASYLTVLDLGGPWPATLVGDASVALFIAARRAWSPGAVDRLVLAVVAVGGLVMAEQEDGHGIGILVGFTTVALLLGRQALLARSRSGPRWRVVTAVGGTAALTLITWVGWAHLLGVPLAVNRTADGSSVIGWPDVAAVATVGCLAAWVVQHWLQNHLARHSNGIWLSLCVAAALVSTVGPLATAVSSTTRAGLVSLHLVCTAAVIALLTPRDQQMP